MSVRVSVCMYVLYKHLQRMVQLRQKISTYILKRKHGDEHSVCVWGGGKMRNP